jgi:hypothetical protein
MISKDVFPKKGGVQQFMTDDNNKNPLDQTHKDNQQKGGEATATDQDTTDVTDLSEDTDLPELDDDTPTAGNDMPMPGTGDQDK